MPLNGNGLFQSRGLILAGDKRFPHSSGRAHPTRNRRLPRRNEGRKETDADSTGQRDHAQIALQRSDGLIADPHSAVGPIRPRDADRLAMTLASSPQLLTVVYRTVDVSVRRAIGSLPRVTDPGRQRRADGEVAQRFVCENLIEHLETHSLGPPHR